MEESPSRSLREPEVRHRTGLSSPTIWRKEAAGDFPRRLKLGSRSVGWLESEIDGWVRDRAANRATGHVDLRRDDVGHRDGDDHVGDQLASPVAGAEEVGENEPR